MIIGINGKSGAGKDVLADILSEHGFVKIAVADELKRTAKRWWDFSDEQLWGSSHLRNEPDTRYPIGNYLDCGCIISSPVKGDVFWESYISHPCENHESGRVFFFKYPDLKKAFLTPRLALQQLGTEVGRRIEPDVWIRKTINIAVKILKDGLKYDRSKGLPQPGELKKDFFHSWKGVVIPDIRYLNEFTALKSQDSKNIICRIKGYGGNNGLIGLLATHSSEKMANEMPDSMFDHVIMNDSSIEDLREKAKELL